MKITIDPTAITDIKIDGTRLIESTLLADVDKWYASELPDNMSTGWYVVKTGSRAEIESVDALDSGTDELYVDPDTYLPFQTYINNFEDEDDEYPAADGDDWAYSEFEHVSCYPTNICIGAAEELGYVILHITV